MRKRVLLASPNHWESPFQVGSHNLAREFARAGWDVAYISDPISPLHLVRGLSADLRRRVRSWWQGGRPAGRVWSYVPAAWLTPHNKPLLRGDFVHGHWHRWTWPCPVSLARRRGFAHVDLLYIDSLYQAFWLDAISYRRSVYRVADYNPHFEKYTPAARTQEERTAARVDLVVYPSQVLGAYAEGLGARRSLLLPNGVDFDHYARAAAPPPEYAAIGAPRAVYMGVMPDWFHFDWVARAAHALPWVSFVLIGPDRLARPRLAGLANVHVLGLRDYAALPGYLQHAQVGLLPFDPTRNPAGVAALNPQKLYAYLASGLPVAATDWEELRHLDCPVRCGATAEGFIAAIREALADGGCAAGNRRFAAGHSWRCRMADLLDALAEPPGVAASAPEGGAARPAVSQR
jgi:hypothetical protein